jgi:glycine/D-amino acid oxidase-like deaminating enzyme
MRICIIGCGIAGLVTGQNIIDKIGKTNNIKLTYIESKKNSGLGTSYGAAAVTLFKNFNVSSNISDIIIDWDCYLNLRFWIFIIRFVLNKFCDMIMKSTDHVKLLDDNYRIFKKFLKDHQDLNKYCVKNGAIYVFNNKKNYMLAKNMLKDNSDYKILDKEQTKKIEPCLMNEDICGSIYSEHDGFIYCNRFMKKITNNLKSNGVTFKFNCEVIKIKNTQNKVFIQYYSSTKNKIISEYYDKIIVCTGYKTPILLSEIDPMLKYDLYPIKGYSMTMPKGLDKKYVPKNGVIFKDKVKFLRPFETETNTNTNKYGARIGGILHFNTTYNDKNAYDINYKLLEQSFSDTKIGKEIYNAQNQNKIIWTDYRPETYNGIPIVRQYKNIYVNSGYGTNGYVLVWKASELITNKLLSDMNK